jgi:hypothetical protein
MSSPHRKEGGVIDPRKIEFVRMAALVLAQLRAKDNRKPLGQPYSYAEALSLTI